MNKASQLNLRAAFGHIPRNVIDQRSMPNTLPNLYGQLTVDFVFLETVDPPAFHKIQYELHLACLPPHLRWDLLAQEADVEPKVCATPKHLQPKHMMHAARSSNFVSPHISPM